MLFPKVKSKIIPIIVPIWRKDGLHSVRIQASNSIWLQVEEMFLVDGSAS